MNDNEQRDELAAIYVDTLNRGHGVIDRPKQGERAAGAILAAGYRKPRTITTVEELDALPNEALVCSRFGVIHEKRVEFDTSRAFWVCPGDTDEHTAGKITLPATVLQEPTTEATR